MCLSMMMAERSFPLPELSDLRSTLELRGCNETLSQALKLKNLDSCASKRNEEIRFSRLVSNPKSTSSLLQKSTIASEQSQDDLKQKLWCLLKRLQAHRRSKLNAVGDIKRTKEDSREARIVTSKRIQGIQKELDNVEISVRTQQMMKNISRQNSGEVVESLKHGLSDIPDDREELETEVMWDINVRLSMINRMRNELRNKQCVVRTARLSIKSSYDAAIQRCIILTDEVEEGVASLEKIIIKGSTSLLSCVFECSRTGRSSQRLNSIYAKRIAELMKAISLTLAEEASLKKALTHARRRAASLGYFPRYDFPQSNLVPLNFGLRPGLENDMRQTTPSELSAKNES